MEPKKKTSKNEWSPAPRKDFGGKFSKKTMAPTESEEKQDKTKKDQKPSRDEYHAPFKKTNEWIHISKKDKDIHSPYPKKGDPKKDQETSRDAPHKKQYDYNKPSKDESKPTPKKVIAKPVDSKKINDKKTGSSGKKNPHTPSSKERIY
jgi:hypothetical protein